MNKFACALIAAGLLTGHAAKAEIVVNGNSVYDPQSGLTWKEQLIPTSTFMASGGWVVAAESQFEQLIQHAFLFAPAPKADWVSALYSLPGDYEGPFVFNPIGFSPGCTSQVTSERCFNFTSYGYKQVDGAAGLYAFVSTPVPAANFGPGYNVSGQPWDVPYVSALVVDGPVPLPAAFWLMLSALPPLLRIGIRRKEKDGQPVVPADAGIS